VRIPCGSQAWLSQFMEDSPHSEDFLL